MHGTNALLFAGLAAAIPAPAPITTGTPSTATAPATTPAATLSFPWPYPHGHGHGGHSSHSDHSGHGGHGIFYPSYTFGSTVVEGHTYPVFGGSFQGSYGTGGPDYTVTVTGEAYLYNCYAVVDGFVTPAVCYGGHESDSEAFDYGTKTYVDAGHIQATGKFPGPQSFSAAGTVGNPGHAVAGGHASGYYSPALNPGQTAEGGIGGNGTATLGAASAGGAAGASFLTASGITSGEAGGAGTAYYGDQSVQGTADGKAIGTTLIGVGGGAVDGAGYTATVTGHY